MADLISLTEYKSLRGITDTSKDAQISALLPMVSDWIRQFCNRDFESTSYTEKRKGLIDNLGRYVFFVKNTPIASVTSLTLRYFGTDTDITVDVTKLDVFNDGGYLYYYRDLRLEGIVLRPEYQRDFYYTIVYTGGTSEVPGGIKLACSYIVADTLRYLDEGVVASGQVNKGNLKAFTLDEYREEYASANELFKNNFDKKSGLIVTPTVLSLIQPYRFVGQS